MTSIGLLHFLHAVSKHTTDNHDESSKILSPELVMNASNQLESDLRQAVCSQRELLWIAYTRIMSIAGPDVPLPVSESPNQIAKLLLIYACKSKLKRKVISLIMKMEIQEQQELMSILKDAEIESCEQECKEKVSSNEMSDLLSENERLRTRLKIAESEMNEWRRLSEAQIKKSQVELSSCNEECHRLQQQLASLNDDLDILKEQNNRIPLLKQSVDKLEEELEDLEELRSKVDLQKAELDKLQLLLIEKDSEIGSLKDLCQLHCDNRDLYIKQQSDIHKLIAEKDALASNNSRLLEELNVALTDVRQLRYQIKHQEEQHSGVHCKKSTDWLESRVSELEKQLLLSSQQQTSNTNEVQRLRSRISAEQDRNTSLSSLLKSIEQKYTEMTRVCNKLRKENESLHEMLTVDQRSARQFAGNCNVIENNEDPVLKDISNIKERCEDISENRSCKKAENFRRPCRSKDDCESAELNHYQQEIRLMSSAFHNLILQFQNRFLGVASAGSSPAQISHLPDSISSRPRNRFRIESVKTSNNI